MIDYILSHMGETILPINPLYSGGFSHTDKCNKDGIVHYILRHHRSEFRNCGVFLKDPEDCFDLSKMCRP